MTRLSTNFTLEEMVFSQTAARMGIDNTPSQEIVDNLRRLCEALEEVRVLLGRKPILVSSGYRSPALNAAVHGAAHSVHMRGLAVDFTVPKFGDPLKVAGAVVESGMAFDQVIHEYGRWVHLGIPEPASQARGQTLSIFAGTGYLPGLRATATA